MATRHAHIAYKSHITSWPHVTHTSHTNHTSRTHVLEPRVCVCVCLLIDPQELEPMFNYR